ncbi:MAG: HIT family protein [Patescibacteria group bacterium]|jgi:histidine triad (HIT) family protein|nr:HIT family protein [Patescibacteria group bacterium]
MSNCIFCKIVEGSLPSNKVYEDENVLAFLDIAPIHSGHILVIPKKHFSNLEEIPEDLLSDVIKVVKQMGLALKKGMACEGYNLVENNDPVAGQDVPHIHFHLIPRVKGDGLGLWPSKEYKEGEAQEVLEKIKKFL